MQEDDEAASLALALALSGGYAEPVRRSGRAAAITATVAIKVSTSALPGASVLLDPLDDKMRKTTTTSAHSSAATSAAEESGGDGVGAENLPVLPTEMWLFILSFVVRRHFPEEKKESVV